MHALNLRFHRDRIADFLTSTDAASEAIDRLLDDLSDYFFFADDPSTGEWPLNPYKSGRFITQADLAYVSGQVVMEITPIHKDWARKSDPHRSFLSLYRGWTTDFSDCLWRKFGPRLKMLLAANLGGGSPDLTVWDERWNAFGGEAWRRFSTDLSTAIDNAFYCRCPDVKLAALVRDIVLTALYFRLVFTAYELPLKPEHERILTAACRLPLHHIPFRRLDINSWLVFSD